MHEAYQPIIEDGRGRFPRICELRRPAEHELQLPPPRRSSTPRIPSMSAKRYCAVWKRMELGSGAAWSN